MASGANFESRTNPQARTPSVRTSCHVKHAYMSLDAAGIQVIIYDELFRFLEIQLSTCKEIEFPNRP